MKKLIFINVIILFLISCNNDDNGTIAEHSINGSWNLKNVSGGIVGVNLDYNAEQVIWTFNESKNSIEVKNNIITTGPKNIYSGLSTGSYTYEIKIDEEKEILHINEALFGVIKIENKILTINDNLAADGFLYTYSK